MAISLLYRSKALTHVMFNTQGFIKTFFALIMVMAFAQKSTAQYEIITNDVQKGKSKKFENKTLKSERTGEKKFTTPRRIIQNTITHYNFYFNANNRLQGVIERSKSATKEDYVKLLPFFNYSLEQTAAQSSELDSVIYKATAGILLHDLRNSWIDDMYMLIGQAYFLKKDFDSAAMTFQFINYNMYPKKRGDEEQLIVGTAENATAISIANPEKKGFTISKKPIRNDALVWQIKTLIQTGALPEAAGLINTLQYDPNFPARLKPELEEMKAYWFYEQKIYDSAAVHLENSLGIDESKADQGRREFLIAQLYELSIQPLKATAFYNKASKHTTDPLLDIYANLNAAKMYKGSGSDVSVSIADLLKMAKKDKYANYRDIVYASAGDLALQKGDTSLAISYYLKGIKFNTTNVESKNRTYFQLAELSYSRKDFMGASNYYDSLQLDNPLFASNVTGLTERRDALKKIAVKYAAVQREDSLQMIAAMPALEREQFVKKVMKNIRRQQGLKDDANTYNGTGGSAGFDANATAPVDLFANNNATSGEWYFYNPTSKSRGYNEFKSRWGVRENVDNWRRRKATENFGNQNFPSGNPDMVDDTRPNTTNSSTDTDISQPADYSYEGMMGNVPLTDELMKRSNTRLATSLFELGKLYQNTIEDYDMAITTYERSLQRFPDSLYNGELYMNLFYVYSKTGNTAKANYYKSLLVNKFPSSPAATAVTNPRAVQSIANTNEATKAYNRIYNYFIEGDFTKALAEKKLADSSFGTNYWTPQLLYIEAVYLVKQRQDSAAIVVLKQIGTKFPSSALKPKSLLLIDVLSRRNEIETYLTNLNVQEVPRDTIIRVTDNISVATKPVSPTVKPPVNNTNDVGAPPPVEGNPVTPFTFNAAAPQFVVMVMNKVDGTYSSEARNAFNRYNREKFAAKNLTVTKENLDADNSFLLFTPAFANAEEALTYMKKVKGDARNEISWLPVAKYSFIIISEGNLNLLRTNKNLADYIKVLKTNLPDQF